jgi:predicted esterase
MYLKSPGIIPGLFFASGRDSNILFNQNIFPGRINMLRIKPNSMTKNLLVLLTVFAVFQLNAPAQNVFNPADPIITYSSSRPPVAEWNTFTKWVTGKKVSWNTEKFKSYFFNNLAFRLRYPNGYNPDDATKKYPVILLMHGGGEIDTRFNNEYSLFVGAELFEKKIDSGLFNAFLLIPQAEIPGWEPYFPTLNTILDTLEKYCHTDPDRLITMGISMGGMAAVQYSMQYPQRSAIAIGSSPAVIQALSSRVNEFIHVPIWLGSGTQDGNPSVENVQTFVNAFTDQGGFIRYNTFPVGHESWYPHWLEQPLVENWKNTHKANPLAFYNRTQIAEGSPVNVRLGLTPGFAAYQWQKDGINIPGAGGNEITATSTGSYRARFKRSQASQWSDWSQVPVVITKAGADTIPPSAPQNLNLVNATTSTIELDWTISTDNTGIASYDVYENDVKKYSTSGSSILITDLTPNTVYRYVVRATDPVGNVSPSSNGIAVRTKMIEATSGLKYKYYEGNWNELPDFAQLVPLKTGFITTVDLSPRNSDNYYSFVWEGYLKLPASGNYTFELVSDDGSKMYFNGHYVSSDKALINNDRVHDKAIAASGSVDAGAGIYPVAFTFFTKEGSGRMELYWTGPGISRQLVPASAFVSEIPPAVTGGLTYKYYEGDWDVLPDFNALKPVKTGVSKNFDLDIRNVDDYFGVTWEGNITLPRSGDYTFELASDDGSKFFFNKQYSAWSDPLISNDGLHGVNSLLSGSVRNVQAGTYPVALAYFEKWGDQHLQLYWSGPGIPRQLVPASALNGSQQQPMSFSGRLPASNPLVADQLIQTEGTAGIISAYPNPFLNKFTVDYQSAKAGSRVEIEVFDLVGRLVTRKQFGSLPAGKSQLSVTMNTKETLKTIYLARVSVNGVPAGLIKLVRQVK